MRSNFIDRTAAVLIKRRWPLVLIFLAAGIVRVVPLTTAQLWRDEAVVGIMSLRVLAGDFPVFFFGQNFMGALEAYLSAVLVLLGGPQAWVLELLPLLLSLFFLFLIERLGNRLLSPSAVRTALIYLALPPVFLLDWAHEARPHYPLTLIFGTLLVLIVQRVIDGSPSRSERAANLAVLGLLGGLGWWTNHLAVVYLLPVFLFLWLHDKKVFLRPAFYLLVLFFLVGQLPQFLFQSRQAGPGLSLLSLIVWPDWPVIGRDFFGNAWPILGGIPYPLSSDPAKWLPYLVFLITTGLALGTAAFQRRTALAGLLRLNLSKTSGLDLLGFVFIATLAINFLTVFNNRLSDNDQKYLLPLYSALPFYLALFLERLDRRRRGAGLLVLFLLLGINLWGILLKPGWPVLDRDRRAAIAQEKKNDLALWQSLRALGITRVYAGEELGARLTFSSAEQVIAADPYQSVSLRYGRWVEGTDRPAYLFQGPQPDWEKNLQALGGGWRKTALAGGFVLYADFRPPAVTRLALPASGWTAPQGDRDMPKAFDGDFGTGWQVPQQTGTSFTLDLGRRETINKMVWWPGDYPEVPGGYRLEVSETGKEWQLITRVENYRGPFFWSGPGPVIKVRRGRVETSFVPVSARFVRLVFLNGRPGGIWSINEMLVYAPREGQVLAQAEPQVLRDLVLFLKEEKIREAFGDPWLSALIHNQSGGKIRTLIYNYFLGDNGERYPPPGHLYPLKINPGLALIADSSEQGPCEEVLSRAGVAYQSRDFGPYRVYRSLVPPAWIRLDRAGWRLTSDTNPRDLQQAIDGKIGTRWTTRQPQAPGMAVRLDLGRLESVGGIMLKLGASLRDYPRELRILASADGESWLEPQTHWSAELYWAGNRLFRMRGDQVVYAFPPLSCRYLKLEQRGSDPTYYWSIHELELLAGQPVSRTR